jgi:hypothetical protein
LRVELAPDRVHGGPLAETVLASFPACPIREIARLGRTLRQLSTQLLAYFATSGADSSGTEPSTDPSSSTAASPQVRSAPNVIRS